MSISNLSALPENAWRVRNLRMSLSIVWISCKSNGGACEFLQGAVVTNGVGHLEGLEGTCKDLREKGCEEENAGLYNDGL